MYDESQNVIYADNVECNLHKTLKKKVSTHKKLNNTIKKIYVFSEVDKSSI